MLNSYETSLDQTSADNITINHILGEVNKVYGNNWDSYNKPITVDNPYFDEQVRVTLLDDTDLKNQAGHLAIIESIDSKQNNKVTQSFNIYNTLDGLSIIKDGQDKVKPKKLSEFEARSLLYFLSQLNINKNKY